MSEDRMGVRASETGAADGCELCVGARNLIHYSVGAVVTFNC